MVHPSAIIVDDHERFRRTVCEFVRREIGLDIVGEGADGQQAIELTGALQPDYVLMDICMPHISGPEASIAIKTARPGQLVLLYSGDTVEVERERDQGVADKCLAKDQLFDELKPWVEATAAMENKP